MLRTLFVVTGLFSTAVLLAQALGLGVLWWRGDLSSTKLQAMRRAMGDEEAIKPDTPTGEAAPATPSQEEIRRQRVVRVLQLDSRENELNLLKRMTSDTANQLISDRRAFDQLKEEFRAELQKLQDRSASAATEQTRAVLMASAPPDSVERLMALNVAEATDLLRGMPEKHIAKLLQAFGTDPKTAVRGQELFRAIYRGDPEREQIQKTMQGLNDKPVTADRGGTQN